ncbi:MAG: hypothetical protein MZV64_07670 [Ignavibacteriales bacterium]|nr:hypothetical protein [Ignavibacteriales bacterium]
MDIEFEDGHLPEIYNAIRIPRIINRRCKRRFNS